MTLETFPETSSGRKNPTELEGNMLNIMVIGRMARKLDFLTLERFLYRTESLFCKQRPPAQNT